VHFACPDNLSPLLKIGTGNMRCLAEGPGALMVLDAERTCSVAILDCSTPAAQWFVNSRVELLGQCLAASALIDQQGERFGKPAVIAARLQEVLRGIDAEAIDHPLSWWKYIMEEFELGMI
jgi:hypothetical protein